MLSRLEPIDGALLRLGMPAEWSSLIQSQKAGCVRIRSSVGSQSRCSHLAVLIVNGALSSDYCIPPSVPGVLCVGYQRGLGRLTGCGGLVTWSNVGLGQQTPRVDTLTPPYSIFLLLGIRGSDELKIGNGKTLIEEFGGPLGWGV